MWCPETNNAYITKTSVICLSSVYIQDNELAVCELKHFCIKSVWFPVIVLTKRSTMLGLLFLSVLTAWNTSTERWCRSISHTILIAQKVPLRPPPFLKRERARECKRAKERENVIHSLILAFIPETKEHSRVKDPTIAAW